MRPHGARAFELVAFFCRCLIGFILLKCATAIRIAAVFSVMPQNHLIRCSHAEGGCTQKRVQHLAVVWIPIVLPCCCGPIAHERSSLFLLGLPLLG